MKIMEERCSLKSDLLFRRGDTHFDNYSLYEQTTMTIIEMYPPHADRYTHFYQYNSRKQRNFLIPLYQINK